MATVAIDAHPIEGHRLLTAAECVDVVAGIDALRAAWAPRGEAFFSLGSAGYLDAVASRPDYLAGAVRTNPPLRARFGALYARVCRTLSRRVGAPVTLADDLALPGFHVFEFDGTPLDGDRPSTRAHFDLQWLSVLPGIAPDATLSFTVLLEAPRGGAALELWPLDYADAPELEMSVPNTRPHTSPTAGSTRSASSPSTTGSFCTPLARLTTRRRSAAASRSRATASASTARGRSIGERTHRRALLR